jgi:hypothetical protein
MDVRKQLLSSLQHDMGTSFGSVEEFYGARKKATLLHSNRHVRLISSLPAKGSVKFPFLHSFSGYPAVTERGG